MQVIFQTEAIHTYQRRFTNLQLREQMEQSHLYIVSRRPRTRLELRRHPLARKTQLVALTSVGRQQVVVRIPAIESPSLSANGDYFFGTIGGHRVHGEAWSLAAWASSSAPQVSSHEVLYIGQAYGREGRQHVEARARKHETIQRIYEEHHPSNWDVFLTPLLVGETVSVNADHLPFRVGNGPALFSAFKSSDGRPTKMSIDVIEHMAISYFQPAYNKNLLEWGLPNKTLSAMGSWEIGVVRTRIQGRFELAHFWTEHIPPRRSHSIWGEVPGATGALKIGLAHRTAFIDRIKEGHGDTTLLFAAGEDQIDSEAEASFPFLTVFGSGPDGTRFGQTGP